MTSVANESGLKFGHVNPKGGALLRYGFRLGLRRGGMGFLVKSEVAIVDNNNIIQFHRDHEADERAGRLGRVTHRPCHPMLETSWRSDPPRRSAYQYPWLQLLYCRPSCRTADRHQVISSTATAATWATSSSVSTGTRKDVAWIVKHLGAITPGIVGIKAGTAVSRRIVQFLQSGGGKKTNRFEIGDMSDGTLRGLAILLALRQTPTPGARLHRRDRGLGPPVALAVLLDAVAASTERCQVLLTSHSPEALAHPAVTAARVRVVDWNAGKSEIFRLSKGAAEIARPPRSVGEPAPHATRSSPRRRRSESRETSSRSDEGAYRILAIVEGDGEERAFPVLLRRWFQHRRYRQLRDAAPSPSARPGRGRSSVPTIALAGGGSSTTSRSPRPGARTASSSSSTRTTSASSAGAPRGDPSVRSCATGRARWRATSRSRSSSPTASTRRGSSPASRRCGEPGRSRVARGCRRSRTWRTIATARSRSVISSAGLTKRPPIRPTSRRPLPFTPGMAARSRSYDRLLRALDALTRAARSRRAGSGG